MLVGSSPVASVRAKTVNTSANPALVIHCLVPLRMKPLPSAVGTAVLWMLPASLPAPGSVRAKAANSRPAASGGSTRRFCSSVPNSRMAFMPIDWWAPTVTATALECDATSSSTRQYAVTLMPLPPYSSGTTMPRTPISARSRMMS